MLLRALPGGPLTTLRHKAGVGGKVSERIRVPCWAFVVPCVLVQREPAARESETNTPWNRTKRGGGAIQNSALPGAIGVPRQQPQLLASMLAFTIARMPALVASGSVCQASITNSNARGILPDIAPSAPDSAPPVADTSAFPDDSGVCFIDVCATNGPLL